MRNGTDRDIALRIVDIVDSIKTSVAAINSNLYSPYILTQPVDVTLAIDETAEFTVSAANVTAYQWEYKNLAASTPAWANIAGPSAATATLSLAVTATRYNHLYRCKLTGKDGTTAYTDEVKIIEPPAENG